MKAVSSLRRPSIAWAAVSALIAIVAIVAISAFAVGTDKLADSLRKFDAATIGICLVLAAWQVGCRFLRWLIFIRRLALKIPVHEAALYYAAAFGMTLTPGRLGELIRLWFLEKRLHVPYRRLAGLYVADRAGDALAYVLLLALGFAGYRGGSPISWAIFAIASLAILAMVRPEPALAALTAIYSIVRRGRNFVARMRRIVRNTSTLFQPGVFLPAVAIGVMGWFAAPLLLKLCLARLGVSFDFLHATAIYATAALTGGSTMLPGGGGATEAVLVVLLRASNVPLEDAVAAMIMTRLAFLWLPVGVGILVLPTAMKSVRATRE